MVVSRVRVQGVGLGEARGSCVLFINLQINVAVLHSRTCAFSACVHPQFVFVANYKHVITSPEEGASLHAEKTKKKTELESKVNQSKAYHRPLLYLDWQRNSGFALGLVYKSLTSTFAGTGPLSRSRKQKAPPICKSVRPSFASLSGRAAGWDVLV